MATKVVCVSELANLAKRTARNHFPKRKKLKKRKALLQGLFKLYENVLNYAIL